MIKKFLWWFTFFVFVLAVYASALYQFFLFAAAWLSGIIAARLTWR